MRTTTQTPTEFTTSLKRTTISKQERAQDRQKIQAYVDRIYHLAGNNAPSRSATTAASTRWKRTRSAALDRIEAETSSTDEYASIVSDILEELRERFNNVDVGNYDRTTTSWPRLSRYETTDRKAFFGAHAVIRRHHREALGTPPHPACEWHPGRRAFPARMEHDRPAINNWDMGCVKNTYVYQERVKLQFRLEMINAFNRIWLGGWLQRSPTRLRYHQNQSKEVFLAARAQQLHSCRV